MLTLKYYHLLFSANQNRFVQKCRNFNTHSINIFQYKKCFVQNKPNTYYRSKQCVYTDFYFKQTGTYYMPLYILHAPVCFSLFSPDFLCYFFHQPEFRPLLFFGQLIADLAGGKSALRT